MKNNWIRLQFWAGLARLVGMSMRVLGSFIQWCQETREDFGLEKAIDAQLSKRKGKVELRHSYRGWREMAKEDPKLARKFGFKDDPKKGDEEVLTLSLETVPVWMPGQEMRGKS